LIYNNYEVENVLNFGILDQITGSHTAVVF